MPAFIKGLHEFLPAAAKDIGLPDFTKSSQLRAFSDYSDRGAVWRTAATLFMPHASVVNLHPRLRRVRRLCGMREPRRIEYKSLAQDNLRWRAVQPWLEAFDEFPGVLFVLVIHNDVASALTGRFDDGTESVVRVVSEAGYGDWSTGKSGERLLVEALHTVHTIAYWHSVLAGSRATLHWLTDNDEIVAGQVRRRSVPQLLETACEKYCGSPVRCSLSTESEINDRTLLDCLSLPDLMAAGVLQHQLASDAGDNSALAKNAVLMAWLRRQRSLKKVCLRAELRDGQLWLTLYQPFFVPS